MRIIFEEFTYAPEQVIDILPKYYFTESVIGLKPNVVGYYNSNELNSPVLILPKVFLNEKNLFFLNEIQPTLFLQDNFLDLIPDSGSRNQIANFLFEASSWFYFSIKKYFQKYKESTTLFEEDINIIKFSQQDDFHTELDIIFSLLKFNKEYKDLFVFIKKASQSQNSKIDWGRTIKKSLPILNPNRAPTYLHLHGKKKNINEDEELIVLFLSLLRKLERKYNFRTYINPTYNLLTESEFESIHRKGKQYLKSIRYKYFDDRLIHLYKLLLTYFEKVEESTSKSKKQEFLIIKNYNLVFQDMVDELLSDKAIHPNLKHHKDNRELDHIYKDKSLVQEDDIYFIGDSKYYKSGNKIEDKSISKQFSYAKNVIQFNIDIFNQSEKYPGSIKYRDEITEGYNITPNFFIRAIVKDINQFEERLEADSTLEKGITNFHFKDRLFDRDTLIVHSYSINFLFVLWSYLSSDSSNNEIFKSRAKKVFRDRLISEFENKYNFNKINVEEPLKEFIARNFYSLIGKVYRPNNFEENSFILALNNDETANNFLKSNVSGNYSISPYKIS